MADEKGGELPKAAAKQALAKGAGIALKNPYVLGGIAAFIIIAGLLFYFFVPAQYKIIFGIAVVVLILIWLSSPKEKRMSRVIITISLAAVIIFFFPTLQIWASEGQSYASNVLSQVKSGGIGEGLTCITNPTKCYGEEPWQTKTSQNFGTFKIDVDWGKELATEPLRKDIGLIVKTENDLELLPICYLENTPIITIIPFKIDPQRNILKFSGSQSIQTSSVKCSSDKLFSNKMALKIEVNNNMQNLALTGYIGKDKDQGYLSAENKSGPFYIKIENKYDKMPFAIGKYPLNIEITPTYKELNISQIKSLKISTISSFAKIDCNFGDELKAGKTEVANWLKPGMLKCNLNVNSLPKEGADKIFINVGFIYDAETTFKTTLNSTSISLTVK